MMHIKMQQVIGLGADGVGIFQHERLCWIQVRKERERVTGCVGGKEKENKGDFFLDCV